MKINKLTKFFIKHKILLFVGSALLLLLLAYVYFQQSVSFSFVDEYDNFIAAYFMLGGKKLFTDIFHNRQFGPVYLSYLIQLITQPESLYQLIMVHRIFVIFFSLIFTVLLSIRFGLIGIIFALLYEPIKFYFHGNLFLGESFIVYPLMYLFFLIFENKREEIALDHLLVGIFFWFACFMREPYIPLATFLLFCYLIKFKKVKASKSSLILIIFLSVLSFIGVNIKDYFFQLFQVNSSRIFTNSNESLNVTNLLKGFLYPFTVFFGGVWNYFRSITATYSMILILLSVFLLKTSKKYWQVTVIFISLGLAALRSVESGKEFYGAYRMTLWYGTIIASVLILLRYLLNNKKLSRFAVLTVLSIIFILSYFPGNFIYKKINREEMFNINYNRSFVNGEIVRILSSLNDTLFVDGYESLIYWQAKIPSSYKYIFYYPVMKGVYRFDQERVNMLRTKTPSFYFIDCNYRKINPIPPEIKSNFRQFIYTINNEETCLYINSNKLTKKFSDKLKLVEKFNYKLMN